VRCWAPILVGAALSGCATWAGDPLADLHPVVWAEGGVVSLHTCRWPDGAVVGLAIAEAASEPERVDARLAAEAWNRVGLGITLRVRASGEATSTEASGPLVVVSFEDVELQRAGRRGGAGLTLAECRRAGDGSLALAAARISVARSVGADWKGRTRDVEADERLGALVHELGHALGHAGHVRAIDGPLVAAPEAVARIGRRVRRGDPIDSAAMRALYGRPSGAVVARVDVERWRTEDLDALQALARGERWEGPWLRAGDALAEIVWRSAGGDELGVAAPDLESWRRAPGSIVFVPNEALRAWFRARRPPGEGAP